MAITRMILELQNATNVTATQRVVSITKYGAENESILIKPDTNETRKIVLVIATSPTRFSPLVKNLALAVSLSYNFSAVF